MHCCLLTAGLFFSSALSTPSVGWRRTLYSTWLLLSLLSKQGNFSCPTPVASELFLCGATSSPVVDGACIGISSSSCQMRTEKHLPLVFKTQALPRTLRRCFMSLLVFFCTCFSWCELNYSQVGVKRLGRKLTCGVGGKDFKWWEAQGAGENIWWWWMPEKVLKTFESVLHVLTLKSKLSQCCVLLKILPVKLCIKRAQIKKRGFQVDTKGPMWWPSAEN